MPSLRLVMGGTRGGGDASAAPVMPLVFDDGDLADETDETWGNERIKGRRRRAVPDTSSEDESESQSPPVKQRVKARKSAAKGNAAMLETADDSQDMSVDGEDDEPLISKVQDPSKSAPFLTSGTGQKRDHRTVEGRTFFIEDEELRLEDDPQGETKMDTKGAMLEGRELSTATFCSPHRADPEKRYILAIDACRAVGFRDSVMFFKRNPLLYKIVVMQQEKDELIDEGRLHPNLRHRQVTMICARNFYKLFGARVVIGGHYVKDDYYEEAARLSGYQEDQRAIVELYDPEIDTGTLAFAKRPEQRHTKTGFGGDVPRTRPPKQGAPSKTLASIAPSIHLPRDQKYGGSGMQPFRAYDPNSKARKPAAGLTAENWAYRYAKAVMQANREIHNWREGYAKSVALNHTVEEQMASAEADDLEREAEEGRLAQMETNGHAAEGGVERRRRARSPTRGVFDPHTVIPHVRMELQPAKAVLEQVDEVPDIPGATVALARAGYASVAQEIGLSTLVSNIEPAFTVPGVWHFREATQLQPVETSA